MHDKLFLYPVLAFLFLLFSVFLANKIIKISVPEVKYTEIDGLRGYLAFFVYLHHCYIWYVFLRTETWTAPESNFFNQLGQTSVVFFFIITAFLFVTKIINSKKNKPINWIEYIKSRFFRLFPAYFASALSVFLIVILLSDFELKDGFLNTSKNILKWLFFTIGGSPDINTIKNTFLINAGVAWSLPFEWMFYFLLPLIALFFKIKVNYKITISFFISFLAILLLNHSKLKDFLPFLGGLICALLLQNQSKFYFLKQLKFTAIIILLLAFSIFFFNSGRSTLPVIITTIVFFIIAAGNSIFGILTTKFSRNLGQITYSFYLFHGIVLFIVFNFIIGYEKASKLSELEHWFVVSISIVPVVIISQLSYKFIELTAINFNKRNK